MACSGVHRDPVLVSVRGAHRDVRDLRFLGRLSQSLPPRVKGRRPKPRTSVGGELLVPVGVDELNLVLVGEACLAREMYQNLSVLNHEPIRKTARYLRPSQLHSSVVFLMYCGHWLLKSSRLPSCIASSKGVLAVVGGRIPVATEVARAELLALQPSKRKAREAKGELRASKAEYSGKGVRRVKARWE